MESAQPPAIKYGSILANGWIKRLRAWCRVASFVSPCGTELLRPLCELVCSKGGGLMEGWVPHNHQQQQQQHASITTAHSLLITSSLRCLTSPSSVPAGLEKSDLPLHHRRTKSDSSMSQPSAILPTSHWIVSNVREGLVSTIDWACLAGHKWTEKCSLNAHVEISYILLKAVQCNLPISNYSPQTYEVIVDDVSHDGNLTAPQTTHSPQPLRVWLATQFIMTACRQIISAWLWLIWNTVSLLFSPWGKITWKHLAALLCSWGAIRLTLIVLVMDLKGAFNYHATNTAVN